MMARARQTGIFGRRDQANRATVPPAHIAMLTRLEAKTRPARSETMAVVRSSQVESHLGRNRLTSKAPYKACSGFTRVTARWIAQPPKAAFVTRLQPSQLPDQTARQLVVCEKGCLGAQAGVGAARHALCRTTRAAQRRAHKALSQATRSRRLWPAAARMALIASPGAPNRRLRSTRPSLFRCPITGSMALRRRSSRRIVGETMPRVCDTGSGRWTRIEDSWVVEQRVGWCAMRRGGEPWRGLLII